MRLPIPLPSLRQRNSTCTRHVSYTGHSFIMLLLLLAMPLLPGLYWLWCRRAAQRFVAQEMPGHAATAGKCDGPVRQWRDAAAACGLFCVFRLRQQLDPTLRLNKGLAHSPPGLRAQNPSGMSG